MGLSSFFYRILNFKNDEIKLLFGSFFFMFVIFASYAILRPIRDVAGLYNDKEILKWLFLATFIVVIIFSILSMWLSGFVARKKYIDSIFIFSSACLLVFFLALWWIPRESAYFIWLMRVFYVWVSVFIMFVLSSAWSLLVDVFSKERSQRLFGIITAGVSLGGIAGSNIVLFLSKFLQLQDFILISMALLFAAIWLKSFIINSAYELLEKESQAQEIIKNKNSAKNSERINNIESLDSATARESSAQKNILDSSAESTRALQNTPSTPESALAPSLTPTAALKKRFSKPAGSKNPFAGFSIIIKSRYLLAFMAFILLLSAVSTFLYMEQTRTLKLLFPESMEGYDKARRQVLAGIDLIVQSASFVIQIFLTSRIVRAVGLPWMLSIVGIVAACGFVVLYFTHPLLAPLAIVMILRRVGEYAFIKPGREMLFVPLDSDSKYKVKNFFDTVVYRGGDSLSSQAEDAIAKVSVGAALLSGAFVSVVWGALGYYLGKKYDK